MVIGLLDPRVPAAGGKLTRKGAGLEGLGELEIDDVPR
jgi:hypothetical protein